MDKCVQAEVTFQDFEVDERFKKLQLSLKLARLRNQCNKNVDQKLFSGPTWSNISSINGDSTNVSYLNSPCWINSPLNPTMSHAPSMKSEILTSSNNLRNILLKKKHYNTNNRKIMATSSVKQCDVNQDKFDQFVMPPPVGSKIYRTDGKNQDRVHMLSNDKKAASTVFDGFVQFSPSNMLSAKNSCISTNTNKNYPQSYVASQISVDKIQKVRVFSRWKVIFNDQYELIIKGTLECGKLVHSKPIVRRYTATCIESKFKHKYNLKGNIVDETNELPDYVHNKFYNGFPDDWENVYLIWKTYISQGCPIKFRWPTPITDSDDDLKSEMTDLTYACVSNGRTVFKMKSYRSTEHNQSEYLSNKSPKEKKIHHNRSANNSQRCKTNTSFAKPFIPNSEDNTAPIAQTRNVNLAHDEDNEQRFKSNANTSYSFREMAKLIDPDEYIQEDKLNVIINNLVDKNCPETYIDNVVQVLDRLNYIVSYTLPSERSYDSIVVTNQDTSKSAPIPQQQITMHNNKRVDTNNTQNRATEQKSYAHSTDPGYESIKNDFITTHQSNPAVTVEPEQNDNRDSDKLESEIYAGIPKISVEQVLRHREKMHKRPARKKIVPQQNAEQHNARFRSHCAVDSPHTEPVQTISITNAKETLLTEFYSTSDEATDMGRRHKVVHQRPHEATFSINPKVLKNNIGVHEAAKPPQQQAHSRIISNVDSKVITVDTNTQEANKSTKSNIYLNKDIVINDESNNNVSEKPRRLHIEFIRQPESEIVTKRSKPIITNSIPVKLNLKISNTSLNNAQLHYSDMIVEEDKQRANTRSTNKVYTKEPVFTTKSVIIKNDSKMTDDNKKEAHPSKKDSTKSMMSPAIEQSNSDKRKNHSKVLIAWIPKVVHYAKSSYKLGLIFQGKLLNETGYVINRHFTTDVILKRLSETLIETVNHEFYELRGHLNDNKHNISKKLAMQCRNGCPANIKQFCLTWETLQNDNNLHDASVDSLKALVSSRGRKIVPPLCYWEGERISMKDNTPVYNPGNLTLFSSNEALSPRVKTASTTKKQDKSAEKSAEKSAVSSKRRIAQRLTYSSTDSEEEKKVSPRKRFRNSQSKQHADAKSLKSQIRKQIFSLRSRALHEDN
nr:PREDICTED: uncharacterized protein LOC105670672 isoform X1 [Linepithema humile]